MTLEWPRKTGPFLLVGSRASGANHQNAGSIFSLLCFGRLTDLRASPKLFSLVVRFCCKTILGARAGNIDSRTAIKAQHRFNESFAPIRLLRVSRLLPSFATESVP